MLHVITFQIDGNRWRRSSNNISICSWLVKIFMLLLIFTKKLLLCPFYQYADDAIVYKRAMG